MLTGSDESLLGILFFFLVFFFILLLTKTGHKLYTPILAIGVGADIGSRRGGVAGPSGGSSDKKKVTR